MWLALSPEGTRARQDGWRSGFYHVALAAQVPVALVYMDYAQKVVSVERFVRMSGDVEADIAMVDAYLAHRVGKRPDQASPVRWNA
jgi:1-acyl-sn-glycerol-3-phosphate acyltransferase